MSQLIHLLLFFLNVLIFERMIHKFLCTDFIAKSKEGVKELSAVSNIGIYCYMREVYDEVTDDGLNYDPEFRDPIPYGCWRGMISLKKKKLQSTKMLK
jgi:hypothetical protein